MAVENNYYDSLPVTLFECFDEITPMSFIFSLKKKYKHMKEILEMLDHCGAKVGFQKSDATQYSAIIADHEDVVNFYAPVFTTAYIQDCLRSKKQLDISKYRQEATRHLVEDSVCMEVVFFRSQSWDMVISEDNKKWIDCNANIELDEPNKHIPPPTFTSSSSCEVLGSCTPESEPPPSLSGSFESVEVLISPSTVEVLGSPSSDQKQQDNIVEKETKSSTSGCEHVSRKEESNKKDIETESEVVEVPKVSDESVFDFDSNKRSQKTKQHSTQPTKRSRQPYTREEQSLILKYIVKNDEYSRIKGRELWTIMESLEVVPNRTWQSMKEHFIKKIAYNLDAFNFLTNEQRRRIQRVLF